MDHDPLDVIAESFRLTAVTQLFLTRLMALALTVLGIAVVVLGFTVWQHVAMRHESAAQTQALLELVRRLHP